MLGSLILCLNLYARADTELIDRIVAVVNGEIITYSELNKYKGLMYMGTDGRSGGLDFDRKILAQMVDKRIVVQEAKKLNIEVKQKEIDQGVESILMRNKITLEVLKESLVKEGSTLEEYRQLLREEIMHSQAVGRRIHANISITDKDIMQYYEQNMKTKEKSGERVRIQQIVLLTQKDASPTQKMEIEKSVNEIREKVSAGEDFGKMAVAYSQGPVARTGGDLGYFHKGELMIEIEEVAFRLEKGEISPVIKTSLGYHLIKVLDKGKSAQDSSWQDHRDEIEEILYNKEFEKSYTDWLQELREKSYIEVNI